MNFKKLDLEDKDLIEKYIYPYKFLSCENSFLTLYIWKDACDIQYAMYTQHGRQPGGESPLLGLISPTTSLR